MHSNCHRVYNWIKHALATDSSAKFTHNNQYPPTFFKMNYSSTPDIYIAPVSEVFTITTITPIAQSMTETINDNPEEHGWD